MWYNMDTVHSWYLAVTFTHRNHEAHTFTNGNNTDTQGLMKYEMLLEYYYVKMTTIPTHIYAAHISIISKTSHKVNFSVYVT